MNTNTSPIIRGEFIYHNVLLVDAGGDLKRHPRASLGDIKTLLDGKTPKDQVAHFYEAQLIHYGLQRTKDKNTAKVRLQQALNQKKLVVPPHIVDMEAQMKKDFAASVRKANRSAAGKAADTATPSGGAASSKKRQQSGEEETPAASSKKTKITMKVGDIEFSIDHDSNEITSGTSKKKATASTKTTAPPKSKATPAPAAKQPKTPQAKKAAPQTDTKAKPTTKKATEAQAKPTATDKVTKTSNKPKPEKSTAVKKETKFKKEPTSAPRTNPPKIKQEPIKREPSPSPPLEDYPEIHYLTGVYDVSCPQLEDQYPETTGTLRILICVDEATRRVWGSFELGPKSGVMFIADYHDDPIDLRLTFGWRARDLDRGGLDFGRGCHGEIEFGGNKRMAGTFFNLFPEPVDFQAKKRFGPLVCATSPLERPKVAWEFEQEWDGFVAEAYGR
jgi:hypothetical protein